MSASDNFVNESFLESLANSGLDINALREEYSVPGNILTPYRGVTVEERNDISNARIKLNEYLTASIDACIENVGGLLKFEIGDTVAHFLTEQDTTGVQYTGTHGINYVHKAGGGAQKHLN